MTETPSEGRGDAVPPRPSPQAMPMIDGDHLVGDEDPDPVPSSGLGVPVVRSWPKGGFPPKGPPREPADPDAA